MNKSLYTLYVKYQQFCDYSLKTPYEYLIIHDIKMIKLVNYLVYR